MPIGARARQAPAALMLVVALIGLVVLAGSAALAGTAAPAGAATTRPAAAPADCGLNAFNELVSQPEAIVLVGVVRSRGNQVGDTSGDGFRYDVTVRRQIPDDTDPSLSRSVTITQARDGAEPVARLKQGEEYFFAAQGRRDNFVATGCAAVLPYDEGLEQEIEQTVENPDGGSTPTPETIDFVLDDAPSDADESSFGRALAPGLAISLIGILGVIAFAIAGRRTN